MPKVPELLRYWTVRNFFTERVVNARNSFFAMRSCHTHFPKCTWSVKIPFCNNLRHQTLLYKYTIHTVSNVFLDPVHVMLNTRVNSRLLWCSTRFWSPTDQTNQLPSSTGSTTHQRTSRITLADTLSALGVSGTDHCWLTVPVIVSMPVLSSAGAGRDRFYHHLLQLLWWKIAYSTSV